MRAQWQSTRAATLLIGALGIGGLGISGLAHADIDSARKAIAASNYKQAVTDLNAVIQQDPQNAQAMFLKGLALARDGQVDDAIQAFQMLAGKYPNMAEAQNNLGVLFARQGKLDKASAALQKAVALNPQYGPAQENLGDVYVALAESAYNTAGQYEKDSSVAQLKSQKLAAFLGNGGGLGGSAKASAAASGPPSVPGVTPSAASSSTASASTPKTAVIDIGTPAAAVKSWVDAWSAQNVDQYLALYSSDFVPSGGQSHGAWVADRKAHVSAPKSIEVTISNLKIQQNGDQALATFEQGYRSDSYHDQEKKALLLGKSADGWHILREDDAGKVHFIQPATSAPAQSSIEAPAGGTAKMASVTMMPGNALGSTSASDMRSTPAPIAAQRSADASPSGDLAATRTQVEDALKSWASAWSAHDARAYMNAYSDDYQPANGQPLAEWIKARQIQLHSRQPLQVTLSDIKVQPENSESAMATFDQHYKSSSQNADQQKTVQLVREYGNWRIKRES